MMIVLFCAALFFAQLAGIAYSHFLGDQRFGYRMFAETTRFRAVLLRVLADGSVVPAEFGRWKTADGHLVSWTDHVKDFKLDHLERETQAKIGLATTLTFFQDALDYVAARIPEDHETARLRLEVTWRKAGGATGTTVLESAPRLGAGR